MSRAGISTAVGGPRRRSLILAGGGYKVAFQAGVLQVWLDEARLKFDHVDGASGGNLNLAMLCQGMTGRQIADNWRAVAPISGVGLNWREWPRLIYARSFLTYDRFRRNVLTAWRLDWGAIRSSDVEATFNVYDFSHHRLEARPPSEMSEDLLIASITLPMWFPPVRTREATFIDAVFVTDGNVEEAIRRGADEIWIIWTVSESGEWGRGFVADYFGIIETVANGNLRRALARVEDNNAQLARGKRGEFDRHIDVKVLRAEVPLNYLVVLGSDRVSEAVNEGVIAARRWCREHGIALFDEIPLPRDRTRFRFDETMSGFFAYGETEPAAGYEIGRRKDLRIELGLKIDIRGLVSFLTDPFHEAKVGGRIVSDALGGELPITGGSFNLLVEGTSAADRRFLYRLEFADAVGHPLQLIGEKYVRDDPGFDVWRDTTTLAFHLVGTDRGSDGRGTAIGAGIAKISFGGFVRELSTFNVQGGSVRQRATLLARFGRMFFGKLWDVYLRRLLPYSPV